MCCFAITVLLMPSDSQCSVAVRGIFMGWFCGVCLWYFLIILTYFLSWLLTSIFNVWIFVVNTQIPLSNIHDDMSRCASCLNVCLSLHLHAYFCLRAAQNCEDDCYSIKIVIPFCVGLSLFFCLILTAPWDGLRLVIVACPNQTCVVRLYLKKSISVFFVIEPHSRTTKPFKNIRFMILKKLDS